MARIHRALIARYRFIVLTKHQHLTDAERTSSVEQIGRALCSVLSLRRDKKDIMQCVPGTYVYIVQEIALVATTRVIILCHMSRLRRRSPAAASAVQVVAAAAGRCVGEDADCVTGDGRRWTGLY